MRARLTLLIPRVGYGALAVACVLVPAVFTRQTAEAFMVPKVTVLWLCLIVMVAGITVWSIAARRWPLPPIQAAWPLGLLVAWTALATLLSVTPWISLLGRYGRYDGFLGVAAGAAVVVSVIAFTWRTPGRLRVLVLAIVGSAGAELAYVIIQQLGWDWVVWLNESRMPIERPYGLLGNSNFSGAHLAICIPLVLALAHEQTRRWTRWALWSFAILAAVGIWWTGTRGGMLAAVAGVSVAAALLPGLVPRAVRWGALAATAIGLVLVISASTGDTVSDRAGAEGPRVLQSTTLADRKEIWATTLGIAADHPLVGVGPDALGLVFAESRANPVPGELPLNADEAHDVFIDRMATSGIPALLAYLWLIAIAVTASWRARDRLPADQRWLLAAFGGALGAYLVQGAFSIDVVPLALLGWVAVGGVLSLADPKVVAARDADDGAPVTLQPLPISAVAAVACAALLAASFAIRPFRADLAFRDGVASGSRNGGAGPAARFAEATRILDLEPRYHARTADHLSSIAMRETTDPATRIELLEESIAGYDDALDRSPGDLFVLRAKARVLGLLADNDTGRRAEHLTSEVAIYREMTKRLPTDAELGLQYGLALETRAADVAGDERARRRRAAERQFQAIIDLLPHSVPARLGLARIAVDSDDLDGARRILLEARRVAPADPLVQPALDDLDALIEDRGRPPG